VSEATVVRAEELDDVRRLTLRYVLAASVILLASGLLGVVLRTSQADVARLGDNTWYAFMTAHGLGAFLGWAGFSVMGFALWVLVLVGFPLRGAGLLFARLTWWLMVLGVAGVVVTTLFMGFAASWVFLYPLSFHSAGQWTDTTAGLFHASVLLVGLSIVTWCLAVVHTVVGPGLHAVSSRLPTRIGVALGFGYLWPRRFATNPRDVPYPVIPLTVIGLDMIVATLPLAGLLVWMIAQSFDSSLGVDPLFAKNILWWFGHPVVYLLLFPAVAIYYYVVPRIAGRPLVAGKAIAIAWAIAVVVNVIIWAHHIYTDYPEGSKQAAINTAMQPLTFAIVIPSALSLYSLAFTIYRSRWQWTGASTAFFLGLVSWLLAGLSGVVNATIVFDAVVHNTLWIVGHFHQMALLNIGLVVFGATYYFLPDLTGRALWSDAMAKWHVWLTFVFGNVNSAIWLWQGLEGAPRRFAVLPEPWDGVLNTLAVPVVLALGAAQLLFVVNVVQTLRGAERKRTARRARTWADPVIEAGLVLTVLFLVGVAGVTGWVIGRETAPETAAPPAQTETAGGSEAGAAVFSEAGCGSCHTFSPAGSTGTVGPSLDETSLGEAEIASIVRNGRAGMPSFAGRLDDEQIAAVAGYVAGG
jgi:cytochrome c oxidase subunit I